MITRALIVGADAYHDQPLTGAVDDAIAFRRTLLELELMADEDNVTLLTSPRADAASGEATYDAITDVLEQLYFDGDDVDRFVFFFAGHGLLAFDDAALTRTGTALMPADVRDLERNARKLIHLTELLGCLNKAGPQEQLYFLDACRNLPYTRHPGMSSLAWGGRTPGRPRRQAVLHAVSELGQAFELPAGRARMTRHLIDALHGRGCAMDYAVERDRYEVTMDSVRNYVRARMSEDLVDIIGAVELALPVLETNDPKPAPIREIVDPPLRSLTVHVVPEAATQATTVSIGLGGRVATHSWPPIANHASVSLEPRQMRLKAYSGAGAVEPADCYIDVREQAEATVQVTMPGGPPPPRDHPQVQATSTIRSLRDPGTTRAATGLPPGHGELSVQTHAVAQSIDVTDLQPPYHRRTRLRTADLPLPAGGYLVEARFGLEPLWSTRVHVAAGERVKVTAPADESWRDAWRGGPSERSATSLDLQLIGLALFQEGPRASSVRDAVGLGDDGDVAGIVVVADQPLTAAIDGRRKDTQQVAATPTEPGGAIAVLDAPLGQTELGLDLGAFGRLELASTRMAGRVTVVTLRRDARGRIDLTQNLFSLRANSSPGSMMLLRQLDIAQRLYASGELIDVVSSGEVDDLLYAKWTDPIFGCMGAFASDGRAVDAEQEHLFQVAGRNLEQHFGMLPDARIAATILGQAPRRETLAELLSTDAVPLLAHGAQLLAAYAVEAGQMDHPAIARRASIPSGQIWNVRYRGLSRPGS